METIVYTKPNCIQCKMTKKLMSELRIPYREVDIESVPEVKENFVTMGIRQMPIVEAEDKTWWGFQPSEIKALKA